MASSAAHRSKGKEGRTDDRRAELLLLLLFWTCAFALSSVRGAVAGEIPFHLMAPHRAAVMLFGALLCWMMVQFLELARPSGFIEKALLSMVGAATMSVLQSLFHIASCRIAPIAGFPPISGAEALSAGLISFGYFNAWTWMHFALHDHIHVEERACAKSGAPAAPSSPEERCFWASRHRHMVRVREADVIWVEAQGDYVLLHAAGGGGMLRETLAALQAKLDPACFIRIHRSAIVRRTEILAIRRRPSGALAVTLAGGEEVPVGRSYAAGVRALIEETGAAG